MASNEESTILKLLFEAFLIFVILLNFVRSGAMIYLGIFTDYLHIEIDETSVSYIQFYFFFVNKIFAVFTAYFNVQNSKYLIIKFMIIL